jgi:hypothetical protein
MQHEAVAAERHTLLDRPAQPTSVAVPLNQLSSSRWLE